MKKIIITMLFIAAGFAGMAQKSTRVAIGTSVFNNEQNVNLEVGRTYQKNIVTLLGERSIEKDAPYFVGAKYLRKANISSDVNGLLGASGTVGLVSTHPVVFKPILGAEFWSNRPLSVVGYIATPFSQAFHKTNFEGGVQLAFNL